MHEQRKITKKMQWIEAFIWMREWRKKGSGAGCTATEALITPDEIYCAIAGDSRTVMCEKGQNVELCLDHRLDN